MTTVEILEKRIDALELVILSLMASLMGNKSIGYRAAKDTLETAKTGEALEKMWTVLSRHETEDKK